MWCGEEKKTDPESDSRVLVGGLLFVSVQESKTKWGCSAVGYIVLSVSLLLRFLLKMPPKKRDKETDSSKNSRADLVQADHELFLQAFESK